MTSLTQHLKQCLAVLRSLRCPCCPRSSEAAPRSSGSAPVPGALLTAARGDKGCIVSVGGGGSVWFCLQSAGGGEGEADSAGVAIVPFARARWASQWTWRAASAS